MKERRPIIKNKRTLPVIANAPPAFHLLAKPTGSTCNINCTYCFFLSKEALYPNEKSRMSHETLEEYIRQLIESHTTPEVTVAWQGGEPTLMRLEFFKKAVEIAKKYIKPGQSILNTFQTNGILLDDEWCAFFKENNFLVGLSVDGPRDIHDAYRVDRGAKGTFDRVMNGWALLQKHGVDCNILCTVNAANEMHGGEVYRFFRDEMHADWIQFIPIVERATQETLEIANAGWAGQAGRKRLLYTQSGTLVTDRSVRPKQYGRFMSDIFDEWVRHDVGSVFVQLLDVTLEAYFSSHVMCVHSETCGGAPVLEPNGDLYSCDHFVEPKYKLGNIHKTHMLEMVASEQQRAFGMDKRATLTGQCRQCEFLTLCNGGCPKDRFSLSKDGEPGHNYLCPGYELFFRHTRPAMSTMAELLRHGRPPFEIMELIKAVDERSTRNRVAPHYREAANSKDRAIGDHA
ncbi:MAG: anaerobic sulfatase maturase [Pyrinomonadaceae bacterium]|nr:anaerobic sulfatase maturase [Pyrinomonadaceae bacterium]